MTELKLKHRRGELTLTDKDVILDNGACWQLITQTYSNGWFSPHYVLSKTTCEKLIKLNKIILIKQDQRMKYYKINLDL